MASNTTTWWIYALLSAGFAALTTIFAKIGIENVNANLATIKFEDNFRNWVSSYRHFSFNYLKS